MSEPAGIRFHEDLPLFREAINFTASRTGFNARLVEKDYFCTVVLAHFAGRECGGLVFKGGTCLAKVYAGFYRLSEDLDFAIPLPIDAGRKTRREVVAEFKRVIAGIAGHVEVLHTARPLQGANDSSHYSGAVEYTSSTTGQRETIVVEVSVREPLLMQAEAVPARTLLLDPVSREPAIPPLPVTCIALAEAMAEKFRAALARKDVAIRDFYDLYYAAEHLGMNADDAQLVDNVRQKLAVPGNSPVDLSQERLAGLRRQLNARLKTVLRSKEFQAFDLNRAIDLVSRMAALLA